MTRTCLNPDCDTELAVIGVCLSCSQSTWKPKLTGVELSDGTVTKGHSKL